MYLRAMLALVVVVGLVVFCAGILRKTGWDKRLMGGKATSRRLSIIETLYLDPKRRLVIVRCDTQEYVLLLGPSGDALIAPASKVPL